jgi:predicted MarR family transcription regulator
LVRAVLGALVHEACHGSLDDCFLSNVLDEWGLGCPYTALQACLRHLEQSGLVSATAAGATTVVRITREGHEVAIGKAQAEGVQPYGAGCPY